jgi:flavodoxin
VARALQERGPRGAGKPRGRGPRRRISCAARANRADGAERATPEDRGAAVVRRLLVRRVMRTLVVYYSRTGTTRELATAIAQALGADVEEIVDPTPRAGLLGYLASGFDSVTQREAPIRPRARDPRDYDLVVVGTPVWAGNMSSPVRAYLAAARGRLPAAAFFCTMGGRGSERAFLEMEKLSGARPAAVLAMREGARWTPTQKAIRDFAAHATAGADRARPRVERSDGAPAAAHAA